VALCYSVHGSGFFLLLVDKQFVNLFIVGNQFPSMQPGR
jgi:hypothetical protein